MSGQTNEALISVVIPTYNRAPLILRAVDSALGQRGVTTEVIVVDDGSTDDTEAVLKARNDARIRYVPVEHRGACAARNRGVREARGAWIAFLDSDDVWHEDKLETQLRQLRESGADVVACAMNHIETDTGERFVVPDRTTPDGILRAENLLLRNLVSTQTLMGRSESIRSVQFDESFPRMQDWDYVIRLTKACRVMYFRTVLVDAYVQSDSISKKPALGKQALRMMLWKYREDYFADEQTLNGMLDEIARYTIEAEAQELSRLRGEWDGLQAELERVKGEREYYRRRYEVMRNPLKGIGYAVKRLKRAAGREEDA